jgi:hypothetical protein
MRERKKLEQSDFRLLGIELFASRKLKGDLRLLAEALWVEACRARESEGRLARLARERRGRGPSDRSRTGRRTV